MSNFERAATLLKVTLRTTAGVYVGVALLITVGQRRLMYPAPEPRSVPSTGQTVTVSFADGTVPLWRAHTHPGAPLAVFMHGNGEQLADSVRFGRALARRGVDLVGLEFPGYGRATGSGPSESSLIAAARASLDALHTLDDRQPACIAWSLGTGVAARMASLASPYTSMAEAAQSAYPWLPARWLVFDRFDTLALAGAIAVPTVWDDAVFSRVADFVR